MTQAAQAVLEAIDHLTPAEREEVFLVLVRRAAEADYEAFTDEELLVAGRNLFQQYDADEEQK
jgi:hypothetical protein